MQRKMILMHKDTPVMDVVFSDNRLVGISYIHDKTHLPVTNVGLNGFPSYGDIADWWDRRSIPKTRFNLDEIMNNVPTEFANREELSNVSLGLSLSDQYWVKPLGANITYDDVNFFDNDFGHQLYDVCMNKQQVTAPKDLQIIGASSSLGGNQKKAWKIIDQTRYLIKESRAPYNQESINEVIGTDVCNALHLSCIQYSEIVSDDNRYSACSVAISKSEDIVSGYDILNKYGNPYDKIHSLEQYKDFLKSNNLEDYTDDMIVVDYILRNTDRHWTNVGVIRDADSCSFVRTFPVFDFGNSLWHDTLTENIDNKPVQNKLTGRMFEDDFKHLKDVHISHRDLIKIPEIVNKHLSNAGFPRDRVLKITDCVNQRVDRIDKYFGLSKCYEEENNYDSQFGL